MQKWEYLTIVASFANGEWRPRWLNGNDVPNWDNTERLENYLNRLGDQGWELVSEIRHDLGLEAYVATWKEWDRNDIKQINSDLQVVADREWELVTVSGLSGRQWGGGWLLIYGKGRKQNIVLRFKRPKA